MRLLSLFTSLLYSLPLDLEKKIFLIFYIVHYVMFLPKKKQISFHHYVHDGMIMKKFFFPNYIIITLFTFRFIKNTTIAATSTTPWSWQKMYIISFQHY